MKVYVVMKENYRGAWIDSVWASKEKANKRAEALEKPGVRGTVDEKDVQE